MIQIWSHAIVFNEFDMVASTNQLRLKVLLVGFVYRKK